MRLSSEPCAWRSIGRDKQALHLSRRRILLTSLLWLLACMVLALSLGAPHRAHAEAWDAGVGDTVYFGSYWQTPVLSPSLDDRIYSYAERVDDLRTLDGVTYRVKGDYYYYKTPIAWCVLVDEGDTLLLLSDRVLDSRNFHGSYESMWDTCDMRAWLNDYFLNHAFTEEDQSYIPVSNNEFLYRTYDDWRTRTESSYATSSEQVFLLDRMDIDSGLLDAASVSTVAYATKFVDSNESASRWWLRGDKSYSYGNQQNNYVSASGSIESYYPTYGRGVRPAIRVDKGAPSLTTEEPPLPVDDMTKTDKRTYPDFAKLYENLKCTSRTDEFHYQWYRPKSIASNKKQYNALYALASEGSYPLPGLTYTRVDDAYCDAMVPQGICVTDKYIIVSAYCSWSGDTGLQNSLTKHKKAGGNQTLLDELTQAGLHNDIGTHDSVLYVLDRNNGSYIKSLALKGFGANAKGNHVGGITYDDDGESIWVAMSQYKQEGKVTECRISMSDIENESGAIYESQQQMVPCSDEASARVASFNTYYNGLIWIGEWTKESKDDICRLVGFEFDGSQLVARKSINIPKSANGVTFFEQNGSTYLAINQSTGRKDDTSLLIWEIDYDSLSRVCPTLHAKDARTINIPPMGEELFVEGDTIWSVYEGGATVYSSVDTWKNRCNTTIDEICCGSVSRLMNNNWYEPFDVIKTFKTILHIACPVDVIGYDEEGHVICIIEGDQVNEDSLAHAVTAYTMGDEKVIEYPSDQAYRFDIIPTDGGTMDITVTQSGDEGMPVESLARYNDLPLTAAQDYKLDIASTLEEETVPERVSLTTGDSEISPTEIVDDSSSVQLVTVTPSVDSDWGRGDVSDAVSIPVGEIAHVIASPWSEGGFIGWYLDGQLISRDLEYTLRAESDINIVARFGRPDDVAYMFDLAHATIDDIPDQTYTGKALTPALNVELDGTVLVAGKDYTVTYGNNKKVGSASVTVTGAGFYTGAKTVNFNIVNKADPVPATQEMHRLYNPNSGEHFYTASTVERDALKKLGWKYEGVGWVAPEKSNTPVYRLYNANAGDHHYTTSTAERDALVKAGWKYEAIGWYSDDAKGTPLYRQYNPNAVAGSHNYTTSKQENDALVNKHGWKAEGIGWYGVKQ